MVRMLSQKENQRGPKNNETYPTGDETMKCYMVLFLAGGGGNLAPYMSEPNMPRTT